MDFPTTKLHKRHTYWDPSNVPLTSAQGVDSSWRNKGRWESSLRPRSSSQVAMAELILVPSIFPLEGGWGLRYESSLDEKIRESKHSYMLLDSLCFLWFKNSILCISHSWTQIYSYNTGAFLYLNAESPSHLKSSHFWVCCHPSVLFPISPWGRHPWFITILSVIDFKENAQSVSCKLSFIWGTMRTAA